MSIRPNPFFKSNYSQFTYHQTEDSPKEWRKKGERSAYKNLTFRVGMKPDIRSLEQKKNVFLGRSISPRYRVADPVVLVDYFVPFFPKVLSEFTKVLLRTPPWMDSSTRA